MNTYVICINNEGYDASLETRKFYQVLQDELASKHAHVRVIDESGEDYLYPAACFLDIELSDTIQQRIESAG